MLLFLNHLGAIEYSNHWLLLNSMELLLKLKEISDLPQTLIVHHINIEDL